MGIKGIEAADSEEQKLTTEAAGALLLDNSSKQAQYLALISCLFLYLFV